MASRRILIVEDDHLQASALTDVLREGVSLLDDMRIETAASEEGAYAKLREAKDKNEYFDAYIVDLMVPLVDVGTEIPPGDIPDPLVAGFRIAKQIEKVRDDRTRPERRATGRKPPIILYTLVDEDAVHDFEDQENGKYVFIKGEIDQDAKPLSARIQSG